MKEQTYDYTYCGHATHSPYDVQHINIWALTEFYLTHSLLPADYRLIDAVLIPSSSLAGLESGSNIGKENTPCLPTYITHGGEIERGAVTRM